jgi:S-adenosylmethionine-diacylglycerol 3-amino-3-carboxypropyl transferase
MTTEISAHADFSAIRYAQCWEDADVLLAALDVKPEHVCVSIASAGDNTLALVARGPRKVIAIDLSSAQLACLALRVAAFRTLSHPELLELLGSSPCQQRWDLYQRCRALLNREETQFWDDRRTIVEKGIAGGGKFERYFELFRSRVLPLVHDQTRVERLLSGGSLLERQDFYERTWNTLRWRWMFRIFFSRVVMGRMGRDPAFFRYVEGSVADRILARTRYAMVHLNPAENPYMQWILCGSHRSALPFALRLENFAAIRDHLDCLEWRRQTLDDLLTKTDDTRLDRFNLSDIFEYMSPANFESLLRGIVAASNPGARLAYWNMLATRTRPDSLSHRITPLTDQAAALFALDKAWFYNAFVLEEVI